MEAKVRCAACGGVAPADARFCPACGAPIRNARPRMGTGLLPAQHLLKNHYAIIRKLAQGGQSAVYLARDTYANNAEFAIKEMSESQLDSDKRQQAINDFMREAQILSSLTHPSLARVIEFFIEDNRYFLVMEYLPGHNLEDEMVQYRREPLDWEDVTRWGMVLADVLAYLHSQQPAIIYRDLKPANVMLLPDGNVKLIDFGIARRLYPTRLADTMQLGTDGYAPLEQYSSRSEPRSDVYALGASLYHLLTGRVPEAAPMRVAGHKLTPIRALNRKVPEPVERVITQALSLQAGDRFPNAQSMREALEWARRQSGLPPSTEDRRRMTPPSASQQPDSYAEPPTTELLYPPGPQGPSSDPLHQSDGPTGRSAHRPTASPASTYGSRFEPGGIHSQVGASHRTGGPAASPRLTVWPLRLDAGYLLVNQVTTMDLDIGNRGGGALRGYVETNIAAITVNPTEIDEHVSRLTIRIDATGLATGPYVCHVAVRTNGGDLIVQVRFVVRPTGDVYGARGRMTSH
jgi:serine/threonine protein kinase